MIDLLHIINKDTREGNEWFIDMAHAAYDGYKEERLYNEIEKFDNMPKEELPLHLNDDFEFSYIKKLIIERLKEDQNG